MSCGSAPRTTGKQKLVTRTSSIGMAGARPRVKQKGRECVMRNLPRGTVSVPSGNGDGTLRAALAYAAGRDTSQPDRPHAGPASAQRKEIGIRRAFSVSTPIESAFKTETHWSGC
jgi:hypothetical protein